MSKKIPISLRINPSTLEWLKAARPRGYQTLINELLDDYVSERRRLEEHRLGRAQEIFKQFYAQCFWHYRKDLKVTKENLPLILDGLKKHGGTKGMLLAEELCQ